MTDDVLVPRRQDVYKTGTVAPSKMDFYTTTDVSAKLQINKRKFAHVQQSKELFESKLRIT